MNSTLLLHSGNKGLYYLRIKRLFGSSLIGYWPLWETAGSAAEDISGNARNGAHVNDTLNSLTFPFGKGIPHFDGVGDYVNAYSVGFRNAFNGAEGFVSLWARIDEVAFQDTTYDTLVRFQANTSNRVYIQKMGTNTDRIDFIYKAGGTTQTVSILQVSTLWAGLLNLVITWSKSNDRVRGYLNGAQVDVDKTGLVNWDAVQLAATTTNIGATDQANTEPFIGHIGHVLVGNREATPAEVLSLYNNCPRKLIVFEGDSRTLGTGATNVGYAYPADTARKLAGNWKCSSVGESGQSVATMITQIAAQISPLENPGLGRIAVLWGGVNDNTDAATMHTRISTWCAAVKALGYQVIVCTEIDCQEAAHGDWHTTNYQALNALILANYTTYADGVADLGGNANLQDATNVTYFNADKTHLTNAGYAEVATIVGAAVNAL